MVNPQESPKRGLVGKPPIEIYRSTRVGWDAKNERKNNKMKK
jgi:hypothetical protein